MFTIAQKRNTSWQKLVLVVCKYTLYWLKKFCVTQKKLWYRIKIKVGVHKCYEYFFHQNGVPYLLLFALAFFATAVLLWYGGTSEAVTESVLLKKAIFKLFAKFTGKHLQ